jgi:hypothetical protein
MDFKLSEAVCVRFVVDRVAMGQYYSFPVSIITAMPQNQPHLSTVLILRISERRMELAEIVSHTDFRIQTIEKGE